MTAPLVSYEQLQARPGFELVSADQVAGLLEDASDLVRDLVRPALDDVEAPAAPGGVRGVVINMVRRGLRNPSGASQESLGDHYVSFSGAATPSLYMTSKEERIVRRAVGAPSIGSQTMTSDLPPIDGY